VTLAHNTQIEKVTVQLEIRRLKSNVTEELLFSIYNAIAEDITLQSAIAEFY